MKITFDAPRTFWGIGLTFDDRRRLMLWIWRWGFGLHFKSRVRCYRCGRLAALKYVEPPDIGIYRAFDPICWHCETHDPFILTIRHRYQFIPREQRWIYR